MSLSILLWVPLAAAAVGLIVPGAGSRFAGIPGAAAACVLAVITVVRFKTGNAGLQFVTDETWIAELGIHYKLGVDGLNLFLVLLATVLFLASAIWASFTEWDRPGLFFFWFGLAESGVLGALLAQDLALFVIFFDLMLVPFLFLTGTWGGENRIAAIIKLFIYTLVGSLLMLSAAIATGVLAPGNGITFVLSDLATRRLPLGSQEWIFPFFAAAFLVKMPAFPVHGWMPDGYRAMPLPVLAVFSGILSKVAAYGFLRVVLPLYPEASVHYQELMLLIALASILYGSAMAFTTTHTRLILGYSSVAQLGFILLGIFSLRPVGAQGAIIQAVNHGLVVAPAFFIVGLLAARAGGSEDIRHMGGIAFRAPVLATMFLIVTFALLAMPGSSNFVGEFLILLGVFRAKVVFAVIAFSGVVMASVYALRMFIRAVHNRVGPEVSSREMTFADGIVLVPLVLAILAFAFYPQIALHKGEAAVVRSLQPAQQAQQAAATERAAVTR